MRRSDLLVAFLILTLTFTVGIVITGFEFLTNQYVYFRFSEDADLPYDINDLSRPLFLRQLQRNTSLHDRAKNLVQAETAQLLALSGMVSLVLGVVSSFMVGVISDLYGRSFTIAVVLLGQAFRFITIAIIILFHLSVVVGLFTAHIFSGLVGGGWIALLVQINVVLADITRVTDPVADGLDDQQTDTHRQLQERRRLVLLGCYDAVGTLAGAIGTAATGSAIEHFGFVPSVLGLLALFTVPVCLIRLLPETRPPVRCVVDVNVNETTPLLQGVTLDHDKPRSMSVRENWQAKFAGTWEVLKTHQPTTFMILAAVFLYSLSLFTEGHYLFLYLMSTPFNWSPEYVGLYSGLNSLTLACASLALILITARLMRTRQSPVPPVRRQLLDPDTVVLQYSPSLRNSPTIASSIPVEPVVQLVQHAMLLSRFRMLVYIGVGFLMVAISRVIMGLAFRFSSPTCNYAAFLALFVGLLRAAVIPTLKSFLSSLHPANAQGCLFSLVGVSEYLGLILGLPTLPVFYAKTVSLFPGAVFLLSASISLVALVLILTLLFSIVRDLSSINSASDLVIPVSVRH